MNRRVRLGLISEGTNTWPLYVAQSVGFFERAGLAVEVTVTGSSVKQQQDLIAGVFDIGFQQADHVVRAAERGADLFIFMAHGHAPDLALLAAPGTPDVAALRGRTIAVDGARTGYALLLRRLLDRHGVRASDVVVRECGGSRERYEALKSGAAAASLLNPPFDADLAAEGYVVLARLSAEFPGYPGPVMAARRAWACAHASELESFVRAYDAAYGWLVSVGNRAEALRLLPARLALAPRAAEAALDDYAQRPRPRISAEGLQQVIDTVWAAEGWRHEQPAPRRYLDLSYAERALAA